MKINRQVRAPTADMLRRYWMFPYQAFSNAPSPSPAPDGGGEKVVFAIDGDDKGASIEITRIMN